MECGYHGCVATSSTRLLGELGIHEQGLWLATKAASEAVGKSNQWLQLKREHTSWCAKYKTLSRHWRYSKYHNATAKEVSSLLSTYNCYMILMTNYCVDI